ncbi:MAG: right-handed parallel beta-helix repeat-containing protein [Bacteroidia bacterium]|nr:right-handed parallel beta-helix repeat-containing protein [Bacteroidia bacterium]
MIWLFHSCEEQTFDISSSTKLSFSSDTLRFDTVFTTIGSATRSIKVYNSSDNWINISDITLGNGSVGRFRINVDGVSGNRFANIEIPPNDSIYIFCEVTVDPDQPLSESPFVINERIYFNTNGNDQSVLLEAWGQNANYLPNQFNAGGLALLTCDLQELIFDDPKPYVIYGVLLVDSCDIVIPAGTQVYVHGGLVNSQNFGSYNDGQFIFLKDASLKTEGTVDNPVIIQGDRLESVFSDVDGQWTGIRFLDGSDENELNHTIIKNSILGIFADSATTVTLKNIQIFNTSNAGILASHATVTAENCLIYNNYGGGIQLNYGGSYEFSYCTIASYGINAPTLTMNNILCLDAFCSVYRTNALEASFTNCIFAGSSEDEFDFFDIESGNDPGLFDYQFNHSIVKVDELITQEGFTDFFDHCTECVVQMIGDPLFIGIDSSNYRLDTMSIALDRGIPIPGIMTDLINQTRDSENPDIGCYEFQ